MNTRSKFSMRLITVNGLSPGVMSDESSPENQGLFEMTLTDVSTT